MSENETDMMLMAYVDGELGPQEADALRRRIEADPELAARAERFRLSREAARDVFGTLLREAAPARLVETVRTPRPAEETKIVPFPMRRAAWTALPLAASIALVFAAGGYWWGQSAVDGHDILGASPVAAALPALPSGETGTVMLAGRAASIQPQSSFDVDGGICRIFDLSGGDLDTALRGVACQRGTASWTVDLAVALGGGEGFAPASAGLVESIDAYLDTLEAQGPLTPQEEAERGIGRADR